MNKIINGILNSLFPDQEVEEEAKRRLFICLLQDGENKHCKYYNENKEGFMGPKCNGCGCLMRYKLRSKDSECPRGLWKN